MMTSFFFLDNWKVPKCRKKEGIEWDRTAIPMQRAQVSVNKSSVVWVWVIEGLSVVSQIGRDMVWRLWQLIFDETLW